MTRGSRGDGDSVTGGESSEETRCGVGPCKSIKCLQYFASKANFIAIFGILGCVYGATSAYSNATISTIEKRFKIPSRITGIISVGNDVSSIFATLLLSYYAGKGHRPRWIAAGMYAVSLFCFLTFLPHLLWGAGEDALALTVEHGGAPDADLTAEVLMTQKRKTLCRAGLNDSLAGEECRGANGDSENSGLAPAILLFSAQFIAGIGGANYYTLGLSYIDDNVEKQESPLFLSLMTALRMLGPALGYMIGSVLLKTYISPSLTPTINNSDPRWLGAWWAGWLVLGACVALLGSVIGMFPRTLPHMAKRQAPQQSSSVVKVEEKASFQDFKVTLKRLLQNKIYVTNNIAAIFYAFGLMPYWIYSPKYIEVQYQVTASRANFFTGSVGLIFSVVGVLLSGIFISRFKPRARYLAAWNVFLSVLLITAILSYPFLGCEQKDLQSSQMRLDVEQQCNVECHCDFVKYSPVCSEDGRTTFISACHAGCRDQLIEDGKKVYTNCTCVPKSASQLLADESFSTPVSWGDETGSEPTGPTVASTSSPLKLPGGGRAVQGPCSVLCYSKFYAFVVMMCLLKFSLGSGHISNMLIGVRCVEPGDKAVSLGLFVMFLNLFVSIPSPIFFGSIFDGTCLVWGKTCTGTGNCWQYDGESMRYLINLIAAAFVILGTLFDVGVWYRVKDLQIFDTVEGVNEDFDRELMEVQDRGQDKQRHLADNPVNISEDAGEDLQ